MRVLRGVFWVLLFGAITVLPEHSQAATTYEYDELGRLIRVVFSNGSTVVYNYDPTGNRTQTVTTQNQPPAAGDDSISAVAGADYDFDPLSNDTDPENEGLTITAKTDGSLGTVSILGGGTQLRYTANIGVSGTDSFTYTIEDPYGASDTATVTANVTEPANYPPDAVNDGVIYWSEQSTYYFDPKVNDTDPDGDDLDIIGVTNGPYVSVEIVTINQNTTLRITTSSTFESTGGFFTYTISDGNGGTDTANVSYFVQETGGGPPL